MNNVVLYPDLYLKRKKKENEGFSFKTVLTHKSLVQPYFLPILLLASKCWAKMAFCWLDFKKTSFILPRISP